MRSRDVRRWAVGIGLSGALVAGCHMGPGLPGGPDLPGTDAGTDLGTDAGTDGGTDVGTDLGPDGGTDLGTDDGGATDGGATDGVTDGVTDGGATDGGADDGGATVGGVTDGAATDGTTGATDGTTDGGTDGVVVPTPLQGQLVAAVNEVRTAGTTCGGVARPAADPLSLDDDLAEAAQVHADWMAETGTFSHTGEGGSSGGSRITEAGYTWRAWGENIAWGQTSVDAVVDGWFASTDHCNNFMDPRFEEVGFGRATSGAGTPYWVANLASPL